MVYKLSPEIRERPLNLGYDRDNGGEVPETVEESDVILEYTSYQWNAAGVARYLLFWTDAIFLPTSDNILGTVDVVAMIGADFALQMERSAHARQPDTPTDSLRRLYETTQEKLTAGLDTMEVGIEAWMERSAQEELRNACTIRGSCADILATPPETLLDKTYPQGSFLFQTHDSIYCEVPAPVSAEVKDEIHRLMTKPVDGVEDGSVSWPEALNAEGQE